MGEAGKSGGQGRISQSSIERVIGAADIGDIASGFTELRKQGGELLGRCPFHDERTPSFWVNPTKGVYFCFGCEARGDTVSFVQEKMGLDFVETIEYLADRYRVELEYEDTGGRARPRVNKKRLYELLDTAATFYAAFLKDAKSAQIARSYLGQRGVSAQAVDAFRIGCSPPDPEGLKKRALAKGYKEHELREAGILNSRGGDLFRERLMIPIVDRAGRVIGFGGRKLREDMQGGKYINSAEGPLFPKRKTLFSSPDVVKASKDAGTVVIVEGYLDVIAMWQAGMGHACAVMGANLSEQQVVELRRLAPRAIFALDPDAAGQRATIAALELAREHELDVRVALLDGGDPDEIIAAPDGRDHMRELLEHAVTLPHYRISALLGSGNLADPGDRERIWREGVALLRQLPDTPERRRQVDRFAFGLGLDSDSVAMLQRAAGSDKPLAEMEAPPTPQPRHRELRPAANGAPRRMSPADSAAVMNERRFLAAAMCVGERDRNRLISSEITPDHLQIEDHRRLWSMLQDPTNHIPLDVARIHSDSGMVGLVAELTALSERERLDADGAADAVMPELELRLMDRWISRSIAALKEQIANADETGELIAEMAQLQARRREVNPRLRDTPMQE